MKRISTTILAIMLLCGYTSAEKPLKQSDREKILHFFANSLNGKATKAECDKRIKSKEIDKMRHEVWSCWKEVLQNAEAEKLPRMSNAGERDTVYWNVPTHPEPDTRMPFHYIKKGEKPAEGYPLFLYMHGSGAKEQEWDTGYRLCCGFDDSPSAYFIPQIPDERHYRWAIQPQQLIWEKLLRLAMVSDDIDVNRIYFFGISEGGYGSQRLASFYADYLAGAGPMAGGEPLINAPVENLANTAFSLLTGDKDYGFGRNRMTEITAQSLDSLLNIFPTLYKHRVELIPDHGHSIDYRPTTPWLRQHKRNPHPAYTYWEDYDMYGRHRKGFGYLRIDSTSRNNDEERTCYEMRISNDTIFLNINNVTYETTEYAGNIPAKFRKHHTPVRKGCVTIFLHEETFALDKPVTILLNGEKAWYGKAETSLNAMIESCALFFDPERIFPAAITIGITQHYDQQ